MPEDITTQNIRNVAVIAHVDHGKTTLIDALLKQTHVFRENQDEFSQTQILDSNDLEKERGITISAKNCAIHYQDTKINIIDTPGHADFSGEVERTLGMADGAILIVDAQEGPMPQTRFVLKKAIELNLRIIVLVNKIDKPFARIDEVISNTESLFLELAEEEHHLEFPTLYAVARDGKVFSERPENFEIEADVTPLLETIIEYVPAPQNDTEDSFKMAVTSLDYSPHLGRILVGKIHSGTITKGQKVIIAQNPGKQTTIEKIMLSQGLGKIETDTAIAGDIVSIVGAGDAKIGDTITTPSDPTPLPALAISEPTLHMYFGPNTSPLSGQEGEFSTSRQLEQRLQKELETNLSLRFEKQEDGKFKLSGRGELHLAVLLETLRREGYEMEVGKPEVITKEIDGTIHEPFEEASIMVPEEFVGTINQELGKRQAEMIHMEHLNDAEVEFMYHMPTRALIGLRSLLATLTKGTVIMNTQFLEYRPKGKPIPQLRQGALIADSAGEALAYGLQNAQGRGVTFIEPGTYVYEGMIIGQNAEDKDISINVCKGKKLTNMRSKSSDGVIQLTPATKLSLEQSLDFLEPDELLEITPKSLRLRKKYLTEVERKRAK